MRRWKLVLGAGLIAALVAVLALTTGGGHRSTTVPPGGSSFGAGTAGERPRPGTSLLDALAPVLEGDQGAAGRPQAGLPAPEARAAARLFLVGFGGTQPAPALLRRLAAREWGGVVLVPGNGGSAQQVADLAGRIRAAALHAHHQAPLVAAVQAGGDGDAIPAGPPDQAAAATPRAAQAQALAAARALRALGVRLALAPAADVGTAGGLWEGRAFSDDPRAVAKLAAAATAGWKLGRVAPAPGHFPGEGSASADPSLKPATVGLSLAELRRRDLLPFVALAHHAPAIQLSAATYVAFDGVTPATLLPQVVRLLRGRLGFRGVIVSGDLAAASLATGTPPSALAVQALEAGCDLLWIEGDAAAQDAAWRAVVRALRTGELPAARVADALRRVSLLRASYGVR